MFAAVANSVMWSCASPLQGTLQRTYDLPLLVINIGVTLIYLIIYIPMTFVSNYIIDEKGIKAGISIGCVLTILGLWIRTTSRESFFLLSLGQAIGSIGAPFILNTPQKLSASWYSPDGRAMSTTLLSLAAPIGVGAGMFISTLFVKDEVTGEEAKSQINHLMWLTAIAGTVMCGLPILLVKEKPPTPPSAGAAKEKFSYSESMKQLRMNKNFLLFLAGASFFWGTYSCLASVMNSLLEPFGYGASIAGIYGLIVLVTGIIGSIGWGVYVGLSKKYKRSLCILTGVSTIFLTILLFVGPTGKAFPTGIFIALYGFFTTPALPIIFEFCCEITFPVAEANAGGLTYMMTQAMGIAASVLATLLLGNNKDPDGARKAFMFLVVMQVIGFFAITKVQEDLKRTRYEQEGESANIEDGSKKSSDTKPLSQSESYY